MFAICDGEGTNDSWGVVSEAFDFSTISLIFALIRSEGVYVNRSETLSMWNKFEQLTKFSYPGISLERSLEKQTSYDDYVD